MANTSIEHNTPEVIAALTKLSAAVNDLSDPLADIAAVLESAAQRSFSNQQTPEGEPWAPLSQTTLDRRKPGKTRILEVSRQLRKSVAGGSDSQSAWVGSNKKYAATQYFGALKGAFGKTKRGAPIPWGTIPSRRYLGLGTQDEEDALDVVAAYLLEAL